MSTKKNKDEDVKIASSYPSRDSKTDLEKITEEISANLQIQKKNGNLRKAQEIGTRLAFDIFHFKEWPEKYKNDPKFIEEVTILLVFSTYHALDKHTPNEIIGETAISVLSNSLRNLNIDYYEGINRSGSYSMYLLTLRRAYPSTDIIGNVFAKLVGNVNDEECTEIGKTIFLDTVNLVKDKIKKAKFT